MAGAVAAPAGEMEATSSGSSHAATRAAGTRPGGISFGEVLSCLNPLQYLPVVGTIYRAVTGDEIPAPVREVGSLVVSGLTGGPIGVAIALGTEAAERAVGFDQEKFGRTVLAGLGIGGASSPAHPASHPGSGAVTGAVSSDVPVGTAPFLAEGAAFAHAGNLDADALNGMELGRLAALAYARSGALAAGARSGALAAA